MSLTRVAILGATGYTGAELLRLLLQHPHVRVTEIVGQSKAGQKIAAVLPALAGLVSGEVASYDAARIAKNADVTFACLPHGASGKIVAELHGLGMPVLDLSADFRLTDPQVHAEWYGHDDAPELRAKAAYGLPELFRDAIRPSSLVAVPGCFPTASTLPPRAALRGRRARGRSDRDRCQERRLGRGPRARRANALRGDDRGLPRLQDRRIAPATRPRSSRRSRACRDARCA